jgi:hypothetical protein
MAGPPTLRSERRLGAVFLATGAASCAASVATLLALPGLPDRMARSGDACTGSLGYCLGLAASFGLGALAAGALLFGVVFGLAGLVILVRRARSRPC